MVFVTTVISYFGVAFLTPFSPKVTLPDIVIIWNTDTGPVAEYIPELQPKFQPGCGVFGMVVGLVPGKEQQIRVVVVNVAYVTFPHTPVLVGVAGKGSHYNLIFGHRVFSDQAFKRSPIAMQQSIGSILPGIPVFDPEQC